ncbi:POTRA domain-containing protein [Cylindrospermum stagnale]|uniref:POTRA domain-containing protein n=1 Tax=Cylindrospermum stagnale TaxID=142864 RepID=UPI0002ED547C|nr:POTRA domain-containing protein [Cylindrospermum stagnale]
MFAHLRLNLWQNIWVLGTVTIAIASSATKSVASSTANWQVEEEPNSVLTQIPSPVRPTVPEPPIKPTTPPSDEDLLQTPPPSPPTAPQTPEIPQTIIINQFEFIGNTAFSNDELAKATQEFIGKSITFTELLQVEAIISRLYTDAGYINSGAVIPAQQSFPKVQAVVKVQIVEGGLEDIQVTGTSRLSPEYIKSRLAIATRRPLNRDRLLQAIQLLQEYPVSVKLSGCLP